MSLLLGIFIGVVGFILFMVFLFWITKDKDGDEENYFESVKCANCLQELEVIIPRGTTVECFLETNNCDRCNCELKRK